MQDPSFSGAGIGPFSSGLNQVARRLEEELREIGTRLEYAIEHHARVVEQLPAHVELGSLVEGKRPAKEGTAMAELQEIHQELLMIGRHLNAKCEELVKVTEADDRQTALVEELNHRIRNMLTIVASVARQTLAGSDSLEGFSQSFLGRIQSMARAYTLVAKDKWAPVDLHALLQAEFRSYASVKGHQLTLHGPSIALKPHAALAMALVVHELTTNAIKFGALSNEKGSLAVTWLVATAPEPSLRLVWHERSDGIKRQEGRKGFGSVLVQREIELSLRGSVVTKYVDDGLCIEVSIPLGENIISSLALHETP